MQIQTIVHDVASLVGAHSDGADAFKSTAFDDDVNAFVASVLAEGGTVAQMTIVPSGNFIIGTIFYASKEETKSAKVRAGLSLVDPSASK